jgi:hypothetical protein
MRALRWVGVVALVLPGLLAVLPGCGGSTPKKPALTNQQRREKAAAEKMIAAAGEFLATL